jgi:hypothetical protein
MVLVKVDGKNKDLWEEMSIVINWAEKTFIFGP